MARKFTYIQQETLRKKARAALMEMIEKEPNEAQENFIKAELSHRYPGYEQLYDRLLVMQEKYNEAKRGFDEIIQKCNDFLKERSNGFGVSRSDGWRCREEQPQEDFKRFIDAKKRSIAIDKGYLIKLDYSEVDNLLVENITMADTKGKGGSKTIRLQGRIKLSALQLNSLGGIDHGNLSLQIK